MIWDINDHQDSRVVNYSSWLYLENHGNLKNNAGVYIFADANNDVKYIGKAGAGRMVDEISSAINREKNKGASLVKALYTNSSENAQSLETDLIRKYNPPNNLT